MTARARRRSPLRIAFATAAIGLLLLGGFWLAGYPVYRFPPPAPFRGDSLFNPYRDATGTWYQANFHAHSSAWGGTTSGKRSLEEVEAAYRALGYDVIGVSNYQRIGRPGRDREGVMPVYEHGYNLMKTHHLVVGARSVCWLDYPPPQSLHQKQFVIDRLAAPGVAVALNHPAFRHGFAPGDLAKLTGYDLVEVLNSFRRSPEHWDAALGAGRRAWIVGNDDTHDALDPGTTGVRWTLVNAASRRPDDIVAALRAGRAYGVSGRGGAMAVRLVSLETAGTTVTVTLDTLAQGIAFVGRGGVVRAEVHGVARASYTLRDDDPYVRVVVEGDHTELMLNPVIRTDGSPPPRATVDWGRSLLLWLVAGAALALALRRLARWGWSRAA